MVPQALADLESVDVREQYVADDDVERFRLRDAKTFAAGARGDHLVVFLAKAATECVTKAVLVLDEKDAHGPVL